MEKIVSFLKEFGVMIVIGLLGVGTLIYGLWGVVGGGKATVEIIQGSNPARSDLIYVDVAGAVQNPGVYKLQVGSRIGDALVAAGGLAEQADRAWVAQTLNLAEVVKDGGKIYIPLLYRETPSQIQSKGVSLGAANNKININTASVAELDALAGIGAARAAAIINNRPYASTDELVTKAKIPQSVYDKIRDLVSVY